MRASRRSPLALRHPTRTGRPRPAATRRTPHRRGRRLTGTNRVRAARTPGRLRGPLMDTIAEKLRAHWAAHGVEAPAGVSEDRLKGFEDRHGVTLPADLRDYFLQVDGMGSRSEFDDDFFSLWPLGEVVRASDEFDDPFIDDQPSYFLFADHSIRLPAYAIRLDRSGV